MFQLPVFLVCSPLHFLILKIYFSSSNIFLLFFLGFLLHRKNILSFSKYSNVRLSFFDLRWAQLYASPVFHIIITKVSFYQFLLLMSNAYRQCLNQSIFQASSTNSSAVTPPTQRVLPSLLSSLVTRSLENMYIEISWIFLLPALLKISRIYLSPAILKTSWIYLTPAIFKIFWNI